MAPWWLRTSNDERTEEASRPASTPAEPTKAASSGPKIAEKPPEAPAESGNRPWWQGGPSPLADSTPRADSRPTQPEEKPAKEGRAEASGDLDREPRLSRGRRKKPTRGESAGRSKDGEGRRKDSDSRQDSKTPEGRTRSTDGEPETDPAPRRRRRRSRRGEDSEGPKTSRGSRDRPRATDSKGPRATDPKGDDGTDEPKPKRKTAGERRRSGSRRKPTSRSRDDETEPRKESPQQEAETTQLAEPIETQEAPLPVERSLLYTLPERSTTPDERKIAVFCDFENIAIGVRESEIKKLDINLILVRLLQKGKIIVKKAYADWERYSEYKRPFHEAAIELIDIPQKYYSGKNSADIKMVVDAMDLCYSKEHLDTFVIVSGDSDFSPLVSKLKENNKYVIGMGVKNSSSSLLIDNCDEFIYYEDVWRMAQQRPRLDNLPPKQAEAFGLMSDAMLALMRENKDVLWGSMIKQTMQRMRPSFNESYYGYSTFSDLLEDAAQKRVIGLKKDQRSGNYVVTGFAVRR